MTSDTDKFGIFTKISQFDYEYEKNILQVEKCQESVIVDVYLMKNVLKTPGKS